MGFCFQVVGFKGASYVRLVISHNTLNSDWMLIVENSKLNGHKYRMVGTIQPGPRTIPSLLPRGYRK